MPQDEMSAKDATTVDVMNQLAGLRPDSPVAAIRALRPDVVRHTQGSYNTLLGSQATAGLTPVERAQVALRVAVLTDSASLMAHYRQRLAALGVSPETMAAVEQGNEAGTLDKRTAAIVRHVDRLTRAPGEATPRDLDDLQANGLSTSEIVTLSQLIAFLSFQVRVLPVLSLLAEGE